MKANTLSNASPDIEENASWLPMVVIAMGQMLMSFNVAALPVSMSGMVSSLNTPPTTVGTIVALMIPYVIALYSIWTLLFYAWFLLEIPWGL